MLCKWKNFSDTNRNQPQHLVEINSLMNGTRKKVDVCNRKKNKVLIPLIILEFSIIDEGVLSEGFMSGEGLCLEGVMYSVCFVRGGFVQRGFCPRTVRIECQ